MTKQAAQIPATSPAYGKEKDMPHLLKVCPSKLITLFLILFHWPKCSYVIPTCHLFDPPGRCLFLFICSLSWEGGLWVPHQWGMVIPAFYGPSSDNRGS